MHEFMEWLSSLDTNALIYVLLLGVCVGSLVTLLLVYTLLRSGRFRIKAVEDHIVNEMRFRSHKSIWK